jgi:predicted trehalose synthase
LRSVDYVGEHALERALARRPDEHAVLERARSRWSGLVRQRFLERYEATIGDRGICPAPAEARALLHLYEIERNLHDVRCQLGQRPDSLPATLRSLLGLLSQPGGRGANRRDGA